LRAFALLAAAALLVSGCSVLVEDSFDQAQAEKVVAAIDSGKLRPDADGEVVLPPHWASVSRTGRVYVNRKGSGLLMILFPTWQGKAWNMQGYLFCSRPLTPADTLSGDPESGNDSLRLFYFAFLTSSAVPRARRMGEEVTLDRKVSANWYHVHRDED
jgi:hypothetical protein